MVPCGSVEERGYSIVPPSLFMKTIIFDIDGTLTDMWPIEKSVLLRMTKGKYEVEINALKALGLSDTYEIFLKVSGQKITKEKYFSTYNKVFDALSKRKELPKLSKYPIVDWIISNWNKYRFLYATGGQKKEAMYALGCLCVIEYFDTRNSIDKNRCRFSKKTGIPFRKIKLNFPDCLLITDSQSDCNGAIAAGIRFLKVKPGQSNFRFKCPMAHSE